MTVKTIALDPPLVHEGGRIAELVLREPLAGQLLAAERAGLAEDGPAAQRVRDTALLAAVTAVSVEALRGLKMTDYKPAVAFLNGFSRAPKKDTAPNLEPDLVLTIEPAIEKNNRVFDLLELRPPTTGDVEAAEREIGARVTAESMRRYQVTLVSRVSGLPRYAIEALRISLLDQASQYLVGFI